MRRRTIAFVMSIVALVAVVPVGGAVAAPGDRTVTVTVERPDGAPLPSGTGVGACPTTTAGCIAPGLPGATFGSRNGDEFTLLLDSTVAYDLVAFVPGAHMPRYDHTVPVRLDPGTGPVALTSTVPYMRLVSGTVTNVDGEPFAEGVAGVAACPGTFALACPGLRAGFADAAGNVAFLIDQGVDYVIGGFAYLGEAFSASVAIAAGTDDVSGLSFTIPSTTVSGHVNWVGAGLPRPAPSGVAACRVPEPVSETCPSLRFALADEATGDYVLALPPGDWNVAAFVAFGGNNVGQDVSTLNVRGTPITLNRTIFAAGTDVTIMDAGGRPFPPEVASVIACPVPVLPGGCATPVVGIDHDGDGRFFLGLDPRVSYQLAGFAHVGDFSTGGAVQSVNTVAGTIPFPPAVTFTMPIGHLTGQVTRTGYASIPELSTGVGACRAPTSQSNCDDLHWVWVNPDGSYDLPLPAGVVWNVGAFVMQSGAAVVASGTQVDLRNAFTLDLSGDVSMVSPQIEDEAPNGGDGNGDGVPDSQQDEVTSFAIGGGRYATMVTPVGTSMASFATIPASELPPPPPGYTAPIGALAYTLEGVPVGGTVEVSLLVPTGFGYVEYWKIVNGTWSLHPSTVVGTVMTFELTDGGAGDDDGVANGVIVDPGAVVVPPLAFGGFGPPVSGTATNVVKAGSTVPLKFTVADASGAPITDATGIAVTAGPCGDAASSVGALVDHGDGRFQVAWKTPKSGRGCWTATVTLADGTSHSATFELR